MLYCPDITRCTAQTSPVDFSACSGWHGIAPLGGQGLPGAPFHPTLLALIPPRPDLRATPPTVPQPFRPLPAWEFKDYLGWMEQGDGKLAYGIYVQVGGLGFLFLCGGARGWVEQGDGKLACSIYMQVTGCRGGWGLRGGSACPHACREVVSLQDACLCAAPVPAP